MFGVNMTTELLDRAKSEKIYEESCLVIPKGVNSPVRSFPDLDETPLVVASGSGDQIVDVDGNRYIDFCQSWGALILGHAHPQIVEATQRRIALGSTFGITTEIEAKLAKKVTELIPSIEKVRFVSSGTEACMSAIRLARGFTGRDLILKFVGNYHGHADSLLIQAGSGCLGTSASAGVPEEFVKKTLTLPYNDIEGCRQLFRDYSSQLAAVIVEPIAANMGLVLPKPGFLEMLREESQKIGALLIFDEVITGFRVALGGAQAVYGIKPDLTCLGKIVGGGFPAAAFGGRGEIMDYLAPLGPVYQAGTLSGNPVAMEAGFQTLSLLERPGFYEKLAEKTTAITQPIKDHLVRKGLNACVQECCGLFTLFFGTREVTDLDDCKKLDPDHFRRFFSELFKRGIYLSPSQHESNFISAAHTPDHLAYTRDAIIELLSAIPAEHF